MIPDKFQFPSKTLIFLVATIIVSALVPIAAPLVGLALIIGGAVQHRQNTTSAVRADATNMIIVGVLLFLASTTIFLFQYPVSSVSSTFEKIITTAP